jgi:hypothetical protein
LPNSSRGQITQQGYNLPWVARASNPSVSRPPLSLCVRRQLKFPARQAAPLKYVCAKPNRAWSPSSPLVTPEITSSYPRRRLGDLADFVSGREFSSEGLTADCMVGEFLLAGVFGPDRGSTEFPPGATSPSSYCASRPARPEEPTSRSQARSPRLSARNLRNDEKLLFSGTSLKLIVRKAGGNPSRHSLFKAMFRAAFRSASSENPHDIHLNLCV